MLANIQSKLAATFDKYTRQAQVAVRKRDAETADREFLPAALEIVETPPSPIAIALLWFICLLFSSALAWSYFSSLDIHAIAQGKIQPRGRSKVVQPMEPGKITAVFVENGTSVKAGDVVAELDPTETAADQEAIRQDLGAAQGEIIRRIEAIEQGRREATAPVKELAFPSEVDASVQARERRVLVADINQLASVLQSLQSQFVEKQAQLQRLRLSIETREKLLLLLKERVDTRQQIDDHNHGYRSKVVDALQEYVREQANLIGEKGQAIEAEAALRSLERKMEQARTEFVADQSQKLAETERKRDRLTQELVKARTKSRRTRLTAPIDGTVQQLAVTTVGQVVSSAQSLMTIVPFENTLEIEAMILNQDIGFVANGQTAVVKVEAFPFTRYGTLDAKVLKVSREAVDEREASGLADPAGAGRSSGTYGANQQPRGQTLVFPAIISIDTRSIMIDGREVPLSAGMVVSVEIRTGQRRMIDYLLSPLREVTSKAGHER